MAREEIKLVRLTMKSGEIVSGWVTKFEISPHRATWISANTKLPRFVTFVVDEVAAVQVVAESTQRAAKVDKRSPLL